VRPARVAEQLHRGDIWLVDLGPEIEPHPCVLLSRDVAMSRRQRAIVAIITSNVHGTRVEVPVGPEDGLDRDSVIDADDLVTLDTASLIRRVGALSPAKLPVLAEALRVALMLPRFEQP
jgi:mRNA interferase MazF